MQEKGRDQEPAEDKAEERQACHQGGVPVLLRQRVQDRMMGFMFFVLLFFKAIKNGGELW